MDFTRYLIGGVASVCATVFTNPIEVIKTRIQLQGELAAKDTHVKPYRGVLQAFVTVAKNDGLLALQKGLVPALYFQFCLNSVRLGVYSSAEERGWCSDRNGRSSFLKGLFWGASGGAVGTYASSPFFLVKTQMQAQATDSIAVGYQHKHQGMINAFQKIFKTGGIKGLWRGATATIPRAMLGGGAQIATFGLTKDFLRRNNLVTNRVLNSLMGGFIAGTAMALAITPPDVILTRIYNQGVDASGKGTYYNGMFDCFWKVWKIEGLRGLYKGFWPNYLRIGSHSVLVLLFFDELMAAAKKYIKF